MAATTNASAAAVDVFATAAAGVERAVALVAAALVDWRRAELSPTAGTVTFFFGGGFLVGMTEM